MSTIPLLARRRLCNTFNAQEVGQLRAALQDAGVEFVITQDSRPVGGFSGYGTSGPALHLGAGAAPFEYTVYVHKDDLALAESAIQGTVGYQAGRRLCFSICSMLPAASAPSPPFQQQGGVEDHQHGAGVVNQGPHHGVEDAGHGQHDGH